MPSIYGKFNPTKLLSDAKFVIWQKFIKKLLILQIHILSERGHQPVELVENYEDSDLSDSDEDSDEDDYDEEEDDDFSGEDILLFKLFF